MKKLLCILLIIFTSGVFGQAHNDLNQFTFDLYKEIKKDNIGKNVVFSGLSLHTVLMMAYYGADGELAKQYEKALHIGSLDSSLSNVQHTFELQKDNNKEEFIKAANKVWADSSLQLLDTYKKSMQEIFKSEIAKINFSKKDSACIKINKWVKEKTNGIIERIISPDDLTGVVIALANAIVFEGKWLVPFDKSNTKDDLFYCEDKSVKSTKFMSGEVSVGYDKRKNYELFAIPYRHIRNDGPAKSMVIILPSKEKTLDQIEEEALNTSMFQYVGNLSNWESAHMQNINLFLPKFTHETTMNVTSYVNNMGIKVQEPHNKITSGSLQFALVRQKTKIMVDEEGTKAAAVTIMTGSRGGPPKSLKINRPFIYSIVDNATGSILFMGRYMQPN